MNLSSFIGTIYIEKLSNLAKIWAEMKQPTLEYLCWTLEFLRWNSNVQRRNSNVGFLISAQIFAKFDDFSMYIVPINDDIYNPIIKSSNLAKIGAELNKPMFEYRCWTLEFLRRNSYVQHLYSKSNQGFPRLGNRQMCVHCAVVKFSNCDGI